MVGFGVANIAAGEGIGVGAPAASMARVAGPVSISTLMGRVGMAAAPWAGAFAGLIADAPDEGRLPNIYFRLNKLERTEVFSTTGGSRRAICWAR